MQLKPQNWLSLFLHLHFRPPRPPARQRRVPHQPQPCHRRGVHGRPQQLVRGRPELARRGLLQEEALHLRGLGSAHEEGEGAEPESQD